MPVYATALTNAHLIYSNLVTVWAVKLLYCCSTMCRRIPTSTLRKSGHLLDFSNAFNSISREKMFKEIESHIPSMATLLECCYGAKPLLHLEDHTILSCCGVQQGDPLGPLAFALALQPILERIKCEVPDLLINAWYLDNGTLYGSAADQADQAAALEIVEEDGPSRCLKLNRGNSLLYIPEDASSAVNSLPSKLPSVRSGFDLIDPCPHCEASMLKRVEKVQEILKRLPDIRMLRWKPPSSCFIWLCPKSVSLFALAHHTSSRCHLCF